MPHFKAFMYLCVLWAEVKSIDENLRQLGFPGLPFPKFLRKRMADYLETGQLTPPGPAAPDSVSNPILPPTSAIEVINP